MKKKIETDAPEPENTATPPPIDAATSEEVKLSAAEQEDLLRKAQEDLLEAKDKYLRLYAEFENYRRRTVQEKIELTQSANARLITALLPVIDDFQRAEKASQEEVDKALEGFRLIHHKMTKALEQFGINELEAVPGADFDPELHEAITKVPAADEALRGKVAEVLEKGYKLHEKVIRYVKVVVGE